MKPGDHKIWHDCVLYLCLAAAVGYSIFRLIECDTRKTFPISRGEESDHQEPSR